MRGFPPPLVRWQATGAAVMDSAGSGLPSPPPFPAPGPWENVEQNGGPWEPETGGWGQRQEGAGTGVPWEPGAGPDERGLAPWDGHGGRTLGEGGTWGGVMKEGGAHAGGGVEGEEAGSGERKGLVQGRKGFFGGKKEELWEGEEEEEGFSHCGATRPPPSRAP